MEIRTVTEPELDAYLRAAAVAFGQAFDPARAGAARAIIELDRTIAAFDGAEIVGTARASGFRLTVPGGSVATAAVQSVTVLPTHRRRGILTALMRRQIDDIRERGEPVACLWATESPIYRRFGYGPATVGVSWEADRRDLHFSPEVEPDPGLEVRLVPIEAARPQMEAVYEALRPAVPGMLERPAAWWDRYLREEDGGTLRAIVRGPDGPAGYASYRVTGSWGYRGPDNRLMVNEMLALSPAAALSLWRYLVGVDLVGTLSAFIRPPDDPLEWLVTDPRALRRRPIDALWVRLVDVGAALRARTWANPVSVTVELRDAFCPWNEGTWSIDAGPDGAVVRPAVAGPADLAMSEPALASVYLGGHRLTKLAVAGLVEERTPGAVRALDLALSSDRSPWNAAIF